MRRKYQFANWAEPSIKQVSTAANRKDQKTTTVSFFFLFLRARASTAANRNDQKTTAVSFFFLFLRARASRGSRLRRSRSPLATLGKERDCSQSKRCAIQHWKDSKVETLNRFPVQQRLKFCELLRVHSHHFLKRGCIRNIPFSACSLDRFFSSLDTVICIPKQLQYYKHYKRFWFPLDQCFATISTFSTVAAPRKL